MELVCKITKEEAEKIGIIEFNGSSFTPFCQETKDGQYIFLKNNYELLKLVSDFGGCDMDGKKWVDIETIEFKNPKFL